MFLETTHERTTSIRPGGLGHPVLAHARHHLPQDCLLGLLDRRGGVLPRRLRARHWHLVRGVLVKLVDEYFKQIRLKVFIFFLVSVWIFYETWGNY